ncbi:Cytochrome c oxidase (cbb3-type) subunit CcoN [hydrothermal vent metagenome]|uniref:Cytochrome c oxidase (Cbb3-type) subunit CcoN n=1 Tax=hydrothermal vent metagenome TaxID=652676 RepID=A0A3B0RGV1_9ZZZZ
MGISQPEVGGANKGIGLDVLTLGIVLVLLSVMGLVWSSGVREPLMQVHIWIMTGGFVLGLVALAMKGFGGLENDQSRYNESIVKFGVIATMFWGIVGFLVGVVIAFQLAFPVLNIEGIGWLNFGRLRPIHTSAVIFAFGGNALMATSFYVVQRTNRARLAGGVWTWFVFWGYQLFIILAASGYIMGITQAREYAEPEWYVDILLTVVWVGYLLVFLGTLMKRKQSHIYVANWFYLAFIVTVAMLHVINNLAVPVTLFGFKSYSAFSGVQDALTQWWYGHNAVGFFLTAGFLGIMYYFIPKRAERPIYSYRLSIIHFWALIFTYIWAGPHHLH